jgi:hypothetical protein
LTVVARGDRSSIDFRQLSVAILLPAAFVIAVQTQSSDGGATGSVVAAQAVVTNPVSPAASITVAVSGEILPHPSIVEHAGRFGAMSGRTYDFAPMFADLRSPLGIADLAICHLEVPVAPPGTSLSGYPSFGIPAEIGDGIHDTGWDRCSTASNHTNDRGTAGLAATLDALDGAQVGHSGTARTSAEAATVPVIDVNGVPVAHLAYTWGFNGTPPAESWMANVIDADLIVADATRAKTAGAAVVIVSLHWGNEFDSAGAPEQRSLADRLLASPDIDLIVGHGPHVLQPIEMFHGKFALLSVGNLVANQGREHPSTYDGVIALITFSPHGDGRFLAEAPTVQPTWYDRDAGRVRLVNLALADPELGSLQSELAASLIRTTAVLEPYVTTN